MANNSCTVFTEVQVLKLMLGQRDVLLYLNGKRTIIRDVTDRHAHLL